LLCHTPQAYPVRLSPELPCASAPAAAALTGGGRVVGGDRVAHRADAVDDGVHRRALCLDVAVDGFTHGAQVVTGGAAATADDARAGIHCQPGVVGHQRRRAGVMDLGTT
jgi:hypothetical protein